MILLFGYALTLDVDRIPTIVYDSDQSPESRELISRFQGSRYFQILGAATDYTTIRAENRQGRMHAGDCHPAGLCRDLLSGRMPQIQLLFDGSDSNTASIALGYANGIVQIVRSRNARPGAEPHGERRSGDSRRTRVCGSGTTAS